MKTLRWFCLNLFVLFTAFACAIVNAQDDEPVVNGEIRAMFDYDANAPLDIQEIGTETRDGVVIRDITFDVPEGDPIPAYVVLPPDAESARANAYAGILYLHWYEPESETSNRTQFVDEAVMLARQGVISVLPATNWEEPEWFRTARSTDTDFDDSIRQVINLRRALDVLLAQHGVDPDRVAVVGHDFGGMYAATMAMVDDRADAYVIIAATPRYADWFFFTARDMPEAERRAYRDRFAPIDPISGIAAITDKAVMFQFGGDDPYVPAETAAEFYAAAHPLKVNHTYDDQGHAMDASVVQEDRVRFLRERLDL